MALQLAPVAPALYNDEGNINWANSTWTNPLFFTLTSYNTSSENFLGNATLTYQFIPELQLKANMGYTSFVLDEKNLTPLSTYDPAWGVTSGNLFIGTNSIKTWIIEPQLQFNKTIGK